MFSHRFFLAALPLVLLAGCASPPSGFTTSLGEWNSAAASLDRPLDTPPELGMHAGLSDHIRFAERNHPGLRAAFDRWHAALQRVAQATSLPDPRLTLGVFLSEVETRTGPMDARLGISQAFPWFGTLAAAGGQAFELAEVAREAFEAERLDVVWRVRDAWYELIWLQAAILVTDAHRLLIEHWEGVARSRYAAGIGSQADVIRAQVELGRLDNGLRSLKDLHRPISARLNAAVGRPAATPVPSARGALPEIPAIDEAALAASLASTSPQLRALARRVDAAAHGTELAEKQSYPDFVLGLDYTFIGDARMPGVSGSGDDALALTLGLELPVYRRRIEAGIAQARALHSAARGEAADAAHRLGAELELALFELRDAHRRVDLYRHTLIPKGEESLNATAGSYQAGNASFLDIIDAERVLLEFQLAAARAESDRAQALARLEALTGTQLHKES